MVLEDRILVWRFKNGSKEALAGIYEKHRDDLLRIAASLLNHNTAAEDIVHDVFIGFVRNRSSFVLRSSLKAYLVTGVVNRSRSFYKTKDRNATIENEQMDLVESRHSRPEQWIITNEQTQILTDALQLLPVEQREVVVLHTQGNLRFRQIADLQAVSTKTAQSRYRYGIEKLRTLLDGKVSL